MDNDEIRDKYKRKIYPEYTLEQFTIYEDDIMNEARADERAKIVARLRDRFLKGDGLSFNDKSWQANIKAELDGIEDMTYNTPSKK